MSARYIFILFCLYTADAFSSDDALSLLKKGQPKDVIELIDRFALCNHWAGEEPYDAERNEQISSAMADLKCERLEEDEAAARKRHAKKPGTIRALQQAKYLSR